jgi:hypothetical protein
MGILKKKTNFFSRGNAEAIVLYNVVCFERAEPINQPNLRLLPPLCFQSAEAGEIIIVFLAKAQSISLDDVRCGLFSSTLSRKTNCTFGSLNWFFINKNNLNLYPSLVPLRETFR